MRRVKALCLLTLLQLAWSVHLEGKQTASDVAISYSYFQKDSVQKQNFEFFIAHGIGAVQRYPLLRNTEVVIIVNGKKCSPCAMLPIYTERHRLLDFQPGVKQAWRGERLTLLFRDTNVGMDLGAHNVTLTQLASHKKLFRYYIFLNSSVRGPFFPSYMPACWEWPQAFTSRFTERVKVVSSSIVCLPESDLSGGGPRVESWAFALDAAGLRFTVAAGVFNIRTCKLCKENGIVVDGEYGISKVILDRGYNLATLQSMYSHGVEWADPQHWGCNNNVHPSRHGTYDGISLNPYETIFVKASWRVGEPFLSRYTRWFTEHAHGNANTAGQFNRSLYLYAVSAAAQNPPSVDRCFQVPA